MTSAWTDVALAYAAYLAILAWLVPRFARARVVSLVAVAVFGIAWWWWPVLDDVGGASAAVDWVVIPSLALLVTYRVSGAFFVQPSLPLERWLLAIDEIVLHRTAVLRGYRAAPRAIPAVFEFFYLLVYAVVPAGAVVLLLAGRGDALNTYWRTVFLAEVLCYAALPWLQSRPPRAIEATAPPGAIMRNLNVWLLRHGSIQGNTFPSAHAAGAIAVALAVQSAVPAAGPWFLIVGTGITLATVLGRYHYALDSILGVGVAVGSWLVAR